MVVGYLIVGLLAGLLGAGCSLVLDHGAWTMIFVAYLSSLLGVAAAVTARLTSQTARSEP
jgi:uncharacterized membrane protein